MLKGLYLGTKLHQVGEILDRLGDQGERPACSGRGRICRDREAQIKAHLTLSHSGQHVLGLMTDEHFRFL